MEIPVSIKTKNDVKKWIREKSKRVLREIGLREGQIILDWGCGEGSYTISAAKIVGKEGRVYALDKNRGTLDEVMRKTRLARLENIERMETSGEIEIGLENESVDIVLLYDVLHLYYFPKADDRKKLLDEVYRVLKPDGLLSVYPKHMDPKELQEEIEKANFHLEKEYSKTLLVHQEKLQRGRILNFKKILKNEEEVEKIYEKSISSKNRHNRRKRRNW